MKGLLDFAQSASNAAASNVSVPVDLLAWALRKAGVPVGDAPVGSSAWMAQKGLTKDVQQSGYSLAGETLGLLSPIVAAAKAPQIAAAANKAIANAQAPRTLHPETGAIVWHGSPHKFDRFDSSKIGTGEGAQAYGHGLYLAESPLVAGQYADNVKDMATIKDINTRMSALVKEMDKYRGAEYGKFTSPKGYELKAEYDALMDARNGVRMAPGSLYKVDLPDSAIARMLDWDKPLSQQAEVVRQAVDGIKASLTGPFSRDMTGDKLLMHIQSTLKGVGRGAEKAEGILRSQGIPGIRYLDGGSRGAGAGTSNFVVFPGEESMLTILERNGKGLLSP